MITRAKKLLQKDGDALEMVTGSIVAFSIKALAASSVFFMNVAIARVLGPAEAGLFLLGFTLIYMLSAISRVGLDNTVVRFVSAEASKKNISGVHGVYRMAMMIAIPVSLLMALLVFFLSDVLEKSVFNQAGFSRMMQWMAFCIPLISIFTLHAQALQGLKKIAKAMLILNVITPVAFLVVILAFHERAGSYAEQIMLASTALAAVFGVHWWNKEAPLKAEPPYFCHKKLLSSCLPLWAVMIFNQIIMWSSQLMLGVWSSTEDIAFFSAAQRTSMLTSFVLISVNSISAPKFSAMYSKGDFVGIRRMALLSCRIMLLAAIPLLLLMLGFPDDLMALFGAEYRQAATALQILAVGQFVNIITGSVGFLLIMTGHEKKMGFNLAVGATICVVLGVSIIPSHGLMGAAIATAISIAIQNILGVFQVRRTLGFNTLAFWQKI